VVLSVKSVRRSMQAGTSTPKKQTGVQGRKALYAAQDQEE
jgi:hypothetical protein